MKSTFPSTLDRRNNLLSVRVHVDSHNNLSFSCTFLSSFQGVLHGEIWRSNTDPTLAHLEFSTVSQQRASAGDSVSIDSITLDPSIVYFYNVSAVPDGESTPVVVVQGVITTPSNTTPSNTTPTNTTPTGELYWSRLESTMSIVCYTMSSCDGFGCTNFWWGYSDSSTVSSRKYAPFEQTPFPFINPQVLA